MNKDKIKEMIELLDTDGINSKQLVREQLQEELEKPEQRSAIVEGKKC